MTIPARKNFFRRDSLNSGAISIVPPLLPMFRAVRGAFGARSPLPVLLDPLREGLHEFAEELAGAVVRQMAFGVEEVRGVADVGFGLLQRRHVEEDERLAEVVVGAEGAEGAGRDAD